MAEVVICVANDGVNIALILRKKKRGRVVVVGVGGGVGVNEQAVIGDQNQSNGYFGFIHAIHAVDGRDHCAQAILHGPALKFGIFTGGGASQPISAQIGAGGNFREVTGDL